MVPVRGSAWMPLTVNWSVSAVSLPVVGVPQVMVESATWMVLKLWTDSRVSAAPRCLTPRLLVPCQV